MNEEIGYNLSRVRRLRKPWNRVCAEYGRKNRNYLNCEADAAAAAAYDDNDDDDGERVNECKRETGRKSDQIKIISAPSI